MIKKANEIPSDWKRITVGEICTLVNGNVYKKSDWSDEGAPIIRIQNLNNPSKPFNYWAGDLSDRVVVKPGDILIAWSGTPGTSFGVHTWSGNVGVLNQHIFRVDFRSDDVLPRWAALAINQQLDILIERAHGGVGLRHVTRREVESLEIVLPPIQEQGRILARIDQLMLRVREAKRLRNEALQDANSLFGATLEQVLAELCAGSPEILPLGDRNRTQWACERVWL